MHSVCKMQERWLELGSVGSDKKTLIKSHDHVSVTWLGRYWCMLEHDH